MSQQGLGVELNKARFGVEQNSPYLSIDGTVITVQVDTCVYEDEHMLTVKAVAPVV